MITVQILSSDVLFAQSQGRRRWANPLNCHFEQSVLSDAFHSIAQKAAVIPSGAWKRVCPGYLSRATSIITALGADVLYSKTRPVASFGTAKVIQPVAVAPFAIFS